MTLHSEIESLSGNKASVYLNRHTLSFVVLQSLADALYNSASAPFKVNPDLDFGAQLNSVKIGSSTSSSADIVKEGTKLEKRISADHFDADGNGVEEIYLTFDKRMIVEVDIGFIEEDTSGASVLVDKFSTVKLKISDFSFLLRVGSETIRSESGTGKVHTTFARVPSTLFAEIANRRGGELLLSRMEGVVGSGVQTVFASTIRRENSISLQELFPGVLLQGSIAPHVDKLGNNLIIIPSRGLSVAPGTVPDCMGIGDGMGDFTGGSAQIGGGNAASGQVSVGGIVASKPGTSLGRRREGEGEIGIYLPAQTASDLSPKTIPGVRITIGGGGFISWGVEAFVGFNSGSVDFDRRRGAITTEIEFTLECDGFFELDLGKILGTQRIGVFGVSQNRSNSIGVAFFPVLKDGVISIKPMVEPHNTNIAPFDVWVNVGKFFGLAFGSFGAAIGFVFDTILSRLVRRKLPLKVREAVSNALASSSWVLIDLSEWMSLINAEDSLQQSGVLYSVESSSILVSTALHEVPTMTMGDYYHYPIEE